MRPKKIILAVAANEQSLSIQKFMLETRGYLVVPCSNGRDAISTFRKGGIDLIVADLTMPEMDGVELVRRLKEISSATPAILFSEKVKMYDKEMHADIFLPKGIYCASELLERIRVLLVRKRGPRKATVLHSDAADLPALTAAS